MDDQQLTQLLAGHHSVRGILVIYREGCMSLTSLFHSLCRCYIQSLEALPASRFRRRVWLTVLAGCSLFWLISGLLIFRLFCR
ncbi:YmiA family putative membrane protein [Tatumella sp. JGM130]